MTYKRNDMTSNGYSVIISKYKNKTTSISNTNKKIRRLPFLKRQWIHRYLSYTTQKKERKKRRCKIQRNIYLEYFHFSGQMFFFLFFNRISFTHITNPFYIYCS